MKTTYAIIAAFIMAGFTAQAQQPAMQYWKSNDKAGINEFETDKENTVPFDGLKVRLGGAMTLQFQSLEHSNTSKTILNADSVNINGLREIGPGFNNATANMNFDVQLEDGISLNLVTYLSSRHHPEAWVKGGYLQFDKMKFLNSATIDEIMEYVTVKVGHMEINYGDSHFRRTDNGMAFDNPFVGNYIMDAFNTEIGGEVYFKYNGILVMAAVSGGEIKGDVTKPDDRKPSIYGKVGYDKQINDDLRTRLTASLYTTESSSNNTLFGGDRTGSRYYSVMDNNLSAGFTSGRFNPGFRDKVTAMVVNPFIKFHGLEIFGNFEQAKGRSSNETSERTWMQIGGDVVYRIGKKENFYVAGRYQTVSGEMGGTTPDVSIDRIQIGAGAFITKNILAKLEYVDQQYKDFVETSIFNGGKFSGVMLEGVIVF